LTLPFMMRLKNAGLPRSKRITSFRLSISRSACDIECSGVAVRIFSDRFDARLYEKCGHVGRRVQNVPAVDAVIRRAYAPGRHAASVRGLR
jgi:hypothetical protein